MARSTCCRALVALAAVAIGTAPAAAQREARVPRIGFVSPGTSAATQGITAFRQGLAELGYVDGRNIVIDPRYAEGRPERFAQVAGELAGLQVDAIAVIGAITLRAVMGATRSIPTVFAIVVDPVAEKLVASMERPGENVTGVTTFDPRQPARQLAILKRAIPTLKHLAILGDASVSEALMLANVREARALGIEPRPYRIAADRPEIETVLSAARGEHVDALLVLEEPAVFIHRKQIAAIANEYRLPTMFAPDYADAGGLLAYGTSYIEGARRMAGYVDQILKGKKPGEIPIGTVGERRLVVNLNTAREIGVTIQPDLLHEANRVLPDDRAPSP